MCIPTIFISYTGEALDYKTPLLKALAAVDKAATDVCQLFDKNMHMNYIHTARSKGLKERTVILRYGLKNAAPVILTAIGQSFGSLITGTIVTETLFNIPGLGMLTLSSINRRDVFVIQGVVLFVTLLYVIVNLAVDVLYGFVDPRLRPGLK